MLRLSMMASSVLTLWSKMTTHKLSKTREYQAYQRMKTYCYNPNAPCFSNYGAKGIKVCKQWVDSFVNFIDDMGKMPENCNGIELLNPEADFCKLNCRWGKKKSGRNSLGKKIVKSKHPKTKLKNPKQVCLWIEKEQLDFIKRQALQKSLESGVLIESNELIRQALIKAFPAPSQFDMFGSRK